MKNLFTILAIFATLFATAQCHTDSTSACCSKPTFSPYVSFGVSMTNTDDADSTARFSVRNYMGLEGGVCYGNLGLGLVLGRSFLQGTFASDDHINNYFTEVKSTVTQPIGNVNVTGLFGYGCYLGTKRNFIEYGVGMSYSVNKFAYGMSYSNWDGVNFVTPNITYNF
jgi:hypothetical protein